MNDDLRHRADDCAGRAVVSWARRLIWLPSLLVGAAVATALVTAAGVLLYDAQGLARRILNPAGDESFAAVLADDTQGLVRAAAVLAGVAAASLVAGLWMGRSGDEDPTVRTAARWWVGLLAALLAGSAFTGIWELVDGFGGGSLSQGLGLAVTGALPAYFAGGVWGRIGGFAGSLGSGSGRQVAIGALAGIGLGALPVFMLLGRPVLAVTAFLGAAVFASGAARCQGWILDRVPVRRVVLRDAARPGLVFEAWRTDVPESEVKVLRDGGRDLAVAPPVAGDWRLGVADTLDARAPILFVGVGSWFAREGEGGWLLHEPDAGVRALAAQGFEWPPESFADSPVPEAPGRVVVVDWETAGDAVRESLAAGELPARLRRAGVETVWVGGRRGRLTRAVAEAAVAAGFGVARYASLLPAVPGPPRLPPRADEAWCLATGGVVPPPVGGLEAVGPDDRRPDHGRLR